MADEKQIEIPIDVNDVIDDLVARNASLSKDNAILTARLGSAGKMIVNQQAQIEELEALVVAARQPVEERKAAAPARRRGAKVSDENPLD